MITRTILNENLDDMHYVNLLSKFQTLMFDLLESGDLVIESINNHKSYIKVKKTNYAGAFALRQSYNFIAEKMEYEDKSDLVKFLNNNFIEKEKLTYDMSVKNLTIIGNKYSNDYEKMKYYHACGYTLKYDKNIPILYKQNTNPLLIHKRILNVDYLKEKLPIEIYEFIKNRENEKLFSVVIEDKKSRLLEFIKFLDLNFKEQVNIFSKILYENTLNEIDV
jgi:hypothetical protein